VKAKALPHGKRLAVLLEFIMVISFLCERSAIMTQSS